MQAAIKPLVATEEAERWLDLGNRFARAEIFDKAREQGLDVAAIRVWETPAPVAAYSE